MQRHPDSLRHALLAAYDEGECSPTRLAQRFGVSAPWVCRVLEGQRPSPKPKQPGGRPQRFDARAIQLLEALVSEQPGASLPVLCKQLAARGGPVVSESTLWRALRRLGFARQAVPQAVRTMPLPSVRSTSPEHRTPAGRMPLPALSGRPREAVAPRRQRYDTGLTDGEWAWLEPLLPAHKPGGRRPKYCLREIVNGIRYVLRTGGAWRHVPHDLPHWEACWHYFRTWRRDGTWQRVHDALRGQLRTALGRDVQPTAAILDSQSVRTTEKGGRAATMLARR